MTAYASAPDDLVLHAPRVLGFAASSRIADRYRLDLKLVEDTLGDFEALGWVQHTFFAGSSGWSITDTGRVENERRLADELDKTSARELVTAVHAAFVPLNTRFTAACTKWQIRPSRADPLAFNDHTDWRWDERVLRTLSHLGGAYGELCSRLTERLQRFDGYLERYAAALAKVDAGQRNWVDSAEVDSCHTVWIQFHEDLLATLGISRGADG